MALPARPPSDCPLCPRLHDFIRGNRLAYPGKFNAPVPSFGPLQAALLIVGLAPGLKGANFSGRPFTGDYAGDLLYETLLAFGLAKGTYRADPEDGLELVNTRITNAVRCVPPQNKPVGHEINTCRRFLESEITGLENLKVIFCLGRVSHESVLRACNVRLADYPFVHAAVHRIPGGPVVVDSYHCSRYNTNTGRLTADMFADALGKCLAFL